jgi:hypothetical protein
MHCGAFVEIEDRAGIVDAGRPGRIVLHARPETIDVRGTLWDCAP